jgi:hypothetical protein
VVTDTPGSSRFVLAANVVHLDPSKAVFWSAYLSACMAADE